MQNIILSDMESQPQLALSVALRSKSQDQHALRQNNIEPDICKGPLFEVHVSLAQCKTLYKHQQQAEAQNMKESCHKLLNSRGAFGILTQVHVCTSFYVCIYTFIYIHIHTHLYTHFSLSLCCVCLPACLPACLSVSVSVSCFAGLPLSRSLSLFFVAVGPAVLPLAEEHIRTTPSICWLTTPTLLTSL